MILLGNQRWRERKAYFRRPDEQIVPRLYEVSKIEDDTTPKAFIEQHHYSASYPAARFRFGLHRRGELVGVAVFSVPMHKRVLTKVFPCDANDAAELGRFVLLDSVEGNGETWFLARVFEMLRNELVGVVSFSDPVQRTAIDGRVVLPGHVGTIYQAHNGVYLGRGSPATLHLLPDGSIFSPRNLSKIRSRKKGWRYATEILESWGADAPGRDPRAWLKHWLPLLTRKFRHPGNHKFAWGIERAMRKVLPASLPYPKVREMPRWLEAA